MMALINTTGIAEPAIISQSCSLVGIKPEGQSSCVVHHRRGTVSYLRPKSAQLPSVRGIQISTACCAATLAVRIQSEIPIPEKAFPARYSRGYFSSTLAIRVM